MPDLSASVKPFTHANEALKVWMALIWPQVQTQTERAHFLACKQNYNLKQIIKQLKVKKQPLCLPVLKNELHSAEKHHS